MLSHRPWSTETVLWLFIFLLQALAVVALVSMVLTPFVESLPEPAAGMLKQLPGTILFHASTLALIAWFLKKNSLSWADAFGLRNGKAYRIVPIAVIAMMVVFPFNLTLMWISQQVMEWWALEPVTQETVRIVRETTAVWQRAILGSVAIVMAPLVEELLFRGLLYPSIKQAGYPGLALFGTSLVFGAIHGNMMTFLPLVFFAVVLAFLYEYTDNLLTPIITHASFNAANFGWLLFEQASL